MYISNMYTISRTL